MEAARAFAAHQTRHDGEHHTHVDQIIQPAVIAETIRPHQKEIATEVIDRHINQPHYHTTVQPLQDREVLPTKHYYQTMPVVKREFFHEGHIWEEYAKGKGDDEAMIAAVQHAVPLEPVGSGRGTVQHGLGVRASSGVPGGMVDYDTRRSTAEHDNRRSTAENVNRRSAAADYNKDYNSFKRQSNASNMDGERRVGHTTTSGPTMTTTTTTTIRG
ncbi:hypothetical protein PMZ80_006072 [Knufia obscura]|uniref:Uncharacterized protein n=2 Tax=Knufia TaxID=430999 RepID=A0AAN8IP38_9EURO|nr:hypothetical protein PMZ80_006072 [Knufia obscura]KAK5954742.1 hypothetical protein OHC33_004466 [Knufia fluminis]